MSDQIFSELNRLLRSKTAKSTGIVFGGNILNAGIGFLSMLIVARVLGPERFGIFSVATAVMAVSAGLADLGIGTGLVRFSSQALERDRPWAMRVFKAGYNLEIIISLAVLMLGWAAAPLLESALGKHGLIWPLRLAFIGASALSMGSYVTAVFQSWQVFGRLAVVNIFANIVKIGAVIWLWQTVRLTEVPAVAAYAAAPVFGLMLGYLLMPKTFLFESGQEKLSNAYRQLLSFSKWIMLSYLINSLITRVDIFLLTRMKDLTAVGTYAAGFQLAQIFPLIVGSLTTVLLPQVSRMSTNREFAGFAKKSLTMSALLIFILAPGFFIIEPIVRVVLPGYIASIGIFKILFFGFLINIVFNPLSTILLAKDRPDILTYTNAIQLVVAFAANLILIPGYGAYGAAYAFVVWTVVGATSILATVLINLKSRLNSP